MKNLVLAGFGSLALAASASATFTGFSADSYQNNAGNWTIDLYANYTSTSDVLLNIFNANIEITQGGFPTMVHNDLAGGSWSPAFAAGDGRNDSFVTIGGATGFANSTTADPNWGAPGFQQVGIPANAGWFNNNPPNLQGKAANVVFHDGSTKIGVWIGRFVANDDGIDNKFLNITASQTNNQGLGTPGVQGTGTGSFQFCVIPAPGALALLGLAGLVGGRRRRA
jgi:uncharacterized protein (TIGR03382 family)